jgi:hypothetical protein
MTREGPGTASRALWAERAETALDAERAEWRALTDRLTAVLSQARTRNRPAASPEKDKQHRDDQQCPGEPPDLVR